MHRFTRRDLLLGAAAAPLASLAAPAAAIQPAPDWVRLFGPLEGHTSDYALAGAIAPNGVTCATFYEHPRGRRIHTPKTGAVYLDGGVYKPRFGTCELLDVNSSGRAVGAKLSYSHHHTVLLHRAVVWSGRAFTELRTLGGNQGRARAINAAGQIVGKSQAIVDAQHHPFHAAFWQDSTVTPLHPTGLAPASWSVAVDVNEAGQIPVVVHGPHAVVSYLYSDGALAPLPPPAGAPAGAGCSAVAINEAGVVAGSWSPHGTFGPGDTRPVLWRDGVAHDLGLPRHIHGARVTALNNHEQVLCEAVSSHSPYLWQNGAFRWLGGLGLEGGWRLLALSALDDQAQALALLRPERLGAGPVLFRVPLVP